MLPCRPAAIRGLRCVCVVLDEVAHFRSTDNQPLDRESWRASLPTLLTPGGKLFALSSPYVASGLLYDLHGAGSSYAMMSAVLKQLETLDRGQLVATGDGPSRRYSRACRDGWLG